MAGRVFGCFFADDFGLEARHHIGIDQITFESDYPHQDTTWPDTKGYAEQAMKDLPQEEVDKIVRGNAIRMLELPETLPGLRNVSAGQQQPAVGADRALARRWGLT